MKSLEEMTIVDFVFLFFGLTHIGLVLFYLLNSEPALKDLTIAILFILCAIRSCK